MGTANSDTTTPIAAHWLSRRRGFIVVAAAAASAIALALGQHWLAVADLLPLLFVLPCVAMMYKCLNGTNRSPQTDTGQPPQDQAPASSRSEGKAAEPFILAPL